MDEQLRARFRLYEAAVQNPAHAVQFYDAVFKARRGRPPRTLREDFAGSSAISRAFLDVAESRTASAIEHDQTTCEVARACMDDGADRLPRFEIHQCDVRLYPGGRTFDVVATENFSYNAFHDSSSLRDYFLSAKAALNDEGVFLFDVIGGAEHFRGTFHAEHVESTPLPRRDDRVVRAKGREKREVFTVDFRQVSFDVCTHRTLYRLSFLDDDGRNLAEPFLYDWRLWTLPELLSALDDVGFRFIETLFETGGGKRKGQFEKRGAPSSFDSFVAYVVAWN